jgi:AcrR family transcriptional regulator
MTTSSPCFQLTGVATRWLAISCRESMTRRTSSKFRPVVIGWQAAETRRAIITAATRLFREHGWTATTFPMIAAEAGTAVDTIYSTFGTKSALMMAVVDVAIVGDDDDTAMVDRPEFALFAKGRRTERLRTGVHFTVGVFQRSVPILKALQEAAASDEPARARLAQYDEDRRNVTAAGLALILGGDVTDDVIDAVWVLVCPEVFVYLTEGRGWSVGKTEAWLVEMCLAAIGKYRH